MALGSTLRSRFPLTSLGDSTVLAARTLSMKPILLCILP